MILDRILGAQNPILIVDSLSGKPQVLNSTRAFVENSGLPFFVMPMAKGIVNESLINFRGVYAGKVSEPGVLEQVQSSDLILVIGPRPTDLNTAGFKSDMPHIESIKFGHDRIKTRGQEFTGLKMSGVLNKLSDALDGRMSRTNSSASSSSPPPPRPGHSLCGSVEGGNSVSSASTPPKGSIDGDMILDFQGTVFEKSPPLTQDWVWHRLSTWLQENDIIAADIGTSYFGTAWTRYPQGAVLLSQLLWCSIGYAVGAAVGAAIAAREDEQKSDALRRRTILFTGDGSLQMTAQEISTMVRQKLPVIVFIINNKGYTIERVIHGMDQEYNDIHDWDYKLLPRLFQAAPEDFRTYDVWNQAELDKVLSDPEFGPAGHFDEKNPAPLRFVELHLPKNDAPEALFGMIDAIKT
jgi:pyruvate decarboxylase